MEAEIIDKAGQRHSTVSVAVSAEMMAAVKTEAKKQHRSASALVRLFIVEGFQNLATLDTRVRM